MAADYYTLLTNAGIAYETACKAAGLPIKLTKMSVGDGNGAVYNPDATATALRREVWRGDINALLQDANNPSWLVAELNIPDDVGGWSVREAGIWTDTGVLYAIIKYPESYKPVLATSGAGKEFYIRAIFQTTNASSVTLVIDETVVKATRAWVVDYVAAELAKLDFKKSVRAVATAPIVLSAAQQVDGVAVVAGDRVLVTGQVASKDNGIWIVANNAWQRALDADASAEVTPGMVVVVEEGVQYADSVWQLVTNSSIVLGTTPLAFELIAGKTGIGAGTYRSLTVDKYGRVVGGANPTTLAGYAITDAYTKEQVDALVAKASSMPVGAMLSFPVGTVPAGWLEAENDTLHSAAAFPDLAAYLGGAFNRPGDPAGFFRNPETRGEFMRGWDHGRGVDAGRAIGSYQKGTVTAFDDSSGFGVAGWRANTAADDGKPENFGADPASRADYPNGNTQLVTSGTSTLLTIGTTRPRNFAVMVCIKAWNAPVNQGQIDVAALASLAAQATEAAQGTAKVATQAMVNAGADDATIVTPKKMRWGFAVSLAANGYIAFPSWLGGLIVQWMTTSHTGESIAANLPLAFPEACVFAGVNMQTDNGAAVVMNRSKTQLSGSALMSATNATGTNTYNWLAVGY